MSVKPRPDGYHRETPCLLIDRAAVGQVWTLATHVEDLTPEQITARLAALGEGAGG
jgi:hypothetical protein